MDRSGIGNLLGKSVNSPRKRMSIAQSLKRSSSTISISGRSNQSVQVICKSANHMVESFGSSLPVLVTEALTFVDKNTVVSASVSPNGWAWVVCGRRLLIWQCKTTIHDPRQRRMFNSQCRELLLPQSDLAHKADCIALWVPPRQQVPSCMAVSPEGIVRYWASIAHEESSVEISVELAGQEVYCLTHVPAQGCILATTTCTIALLQPQFINGRNSLTSRVLKTSQGWLGGLGRRMSMIFGVIPQNPAMETKLVKVHCIETNEKGSKVLILAGSSLQLWHFPVHENEKMIFDEDISNMVSQAFQRRMNNFNMATQSKDFDSFNNMNTSLLDMQTCEEGIVVLTAADNTNYSNQFDLALGLIPLTSDGQLSHQFKWFNLVQNCGWSCQMNPIIQFEDPYRFILSGWEAIIYNKRNIVVCNINHSAMADFDEIDLTSNKDDSILGGALCSGTPVLFTKNLGFVTIVAVDFAGQDFNSSYLDTTPNVDYNMSYNMSRNQDNFSMSVTNDEIREMHHSADGTMQLRAAFLMSLRQNRIQADEILAELFPPQEESVMDIDATLDTLILKVARDLIDDYPANDPRWTNYRDLTVTMNIVIAMQISLQLEGKQSALDLFVNFLKEHNLWNRFCAVTYRDVVMATSHVLGEFSEKIVAAIAIHACQQRYPEIIEEAIKKTLSPDSYISDELTPQDIFYREVSKVHLLLPNLVQLAAEMTQTDRQTHEVSQYIMQVNSILLSVLQDVVKYRQFTAEAYVPTRCSNGITEYLPWTAATGKHGLRNSLNQMQKITLKHGITGTNDSTIRNELFEQLVSLIDLLLDGRKCHLESIRGTEKFELYLKQYEAERTSLIQPLLKEEQYENAAMLAEKYCDFASLIQICELTNNKKRLDNYMERFASQDFAGFLFAWQVKHGRQGQLVERCRRGGAAELSEKLAEHPHLSWIHSIQNDEFRSAANTLHTLSMQEEELLARKKTLLSLAKLALIASDDPKSTIKEYTSGIDNELTLIAHQEDLPIAVLESYGYSVEKMKVLSPAELINLYTCEENELLSEYDFKKALDLLVYIENDDEKTALKLRVWARAARRDKWDNLTNNPETQVQSTVFFKLMDLLHSVGDEKIEDSIVPVNNLLSESELGELAVSTNFQYLIKLIYEYAYHNN